MNRHESKLTRHRRRRRSIRKRVFGMPDRPRLTVRRTATNIYAQIIDDAGGRTIATASSIEKGGRLQQGGNCAAAAEIGKRIADKAKAAGVESVVFDRNGNRYHGRLKALADAAREGGLKF